MSVASLEDLEDGELPSSDDEECNKKQTKESLLNDGDTSMASGNVPGHPPGKDEVAVSDTTTTTTIVDPVVDTETVNSRKRPFQSPEPEQKEAVDSDEVSPKKPKTATESSDQSDLEEGEIYSDDEEAAYYPNLVKSRISETTTNNTASKSKDQSRRKRRRSNSRSPGTRESNYSSSSRQYRSGERNDRKNYLPGNRNKDSRSSSWRDRRGSMRSRGKSHGYSNSNNEYSSSSGRHSRSGGNASERWEEFPPNVSQQPVLTLAMLEARLKEAKAIFPTPNITPCYSLDEFNYPAPPQWYLRAVGAYNKRMGYRGRGRGGPIWRGGSASDEGAKLDVLSDNLGYQYVPPPFVKPTPLFETVTEPPVVSATPPSNMNTGVHPIGGPAFHAHAGAGPFPVNTRPLPVNTGSFPGSSVVVNPGPVGGMHDLLVHPPPNTNVAHPLSQAPPTDIQVEVEQKPNIPVADELNIEPLFESNLFESFPKAEDSNTTIKDQLVSSHSLDEGDLIIAKDEEDNDRENDYDDISPSPPQAPDSSVELGITSSTVSTCTLSTQSLGRRGKMTILGHSSKQGFARQPKAPKNLVISIDLGKIQVHGDEEAFEAPENEDFDYDDYLDQLNDEEEEDKPLSSFWIDTNPDPHTPSSSNAQSDSKENTDSTCSSVTGEVPSQALLGNPLDEDFPTTDGGSNVKGTGTGEVTLCSLVGVEPDGNSEMADEEKEHGKRGGNKGRASLKYLEKSYWTKQDRINKQKQHQQHQRPLAPINNTSVQEAQHQLPSLPTGTAQEPQKPTAQEPQRSSQPCKYYLQGYCIHGDNCQYNHSVPREKKKEMCKFYLQDACDKGDDCIFYHGNFPCKYFHGRHMCYHGDKCKFSHAPLTLEGYDLLMGVIEPNLRDQVQFPGLEGSQPPPPPHILRGTPAILPEPSLSMHHPPPNYGGPVSALPPAAPPPGFIPTCSASMPPINQFSSPDPHAPILQQPPTHSVPPQPHALHPVHQSHPHSVPQPYATPQPQTNASSMQPASSNISNISCNVKLPPSFDVESLFPDEHPQVLPHDLATQLRTVLLDTPSTVSEEDKKKQQEEEEFELFYWENTRNNNTNTDAATDNIQTYSVTGGGEALPLQQQFFDGEEGHTLRTSDHFNRIDVSSSALASSHQSIPPHAVRGGVSPYRPPFEPQRTKLSPPRQDLPPHYRGPPPHHAPGVGGIMNHQLPPDPRQAHHVVTGLKNISTRKLSPDPRIEHSRDPRQTYQQDPRTYNNKDHVMNATSMGLTVEPSRTLHSETPPTNNPSSIPRSQSYSQPHSDTIPNSTKQFNSINDSYSIPKASAANSWSSSNNINESLADRTSVKAPERLVDPRRKYSQFKIKPKSSTVEKKSNESLPELLRDSSILDKPIAPKDLFVNYPSGISLFGSGSQLDNESGENHEYGEIKMRRDSVHQQDEAKDNDNSTNNMAGEQDEEIPIIPSYLTHLNLGIEEESIDSAFGTLMSRKRRLSELTSSSDKTDSNQLPSNDQDKTTTSSTASNVFSFGSSLYSS